MKLTAYLRAAAVLATLSSAAPALAETPVEAYADQVIGKGLGILKDASLKGSARDGAIRDFLKASLDIRRIALFTLGDAARTASPADVAAYTDAFENFTLTSYVSRVGAYGGQGLKVAVAVERAPGDYIVTVNVVDPTASASSPPDTAEFRVLKETDGHFAVVDASVQGVWFEVAQRSDIQGFLEQNGGSIPKLIDHLKQMTAQLASNP